MLRIIMSLKPKTSDLLKYTFLQYIGIEKAFKLKIHNQMFHIILFFHKIPLKNRIKAQFS